MISDVYFDNESNTSQKLSRAVNGRFFVRNSLGIEEVHLIRAEDLRVL